MLRKLAVVFLLCGMVGCMVNVPVVVGADLSHSWILAEDHGSKDRIYNDAKFDFEFIKNMKNNGYVATVTRKDNTFDNNSVQFMYQILIVDKENKFKIVPKYIFLKSGQKSAKVTENTSELVGLQSDIYGIKFPITDYPKYTNADLSIRDSLFNLKITYDYTYKPWASSGINCNFTNRQFQTLNCPVTLKRAITLGFKGAPVKTEWVTFKLNPETRYSCVFKNWEDELSSFQTGADDYYLQFQ